MGTIHKILHERGGWCVAKKVGDRWHRVSSLYRFRGFAQAFARRMKINVVNYESNFALSLLDSLQAIRFNQFSTNMYRYYKSHTTGEYVVMFDNRIVGAVEDKRFLNENDAKVRVYEMNLSQHLCNAIRYTKDKMRNYDWATILHCSRSNDSMLYGIAQRVADRVCRYMDEYGEKFGLLSDWWVPLATDEYEIMKRMVSLSLRLHFAATITKPIEL